MADPLRDLSRDLIALARQFDGKARDDIVRALGGEGVKQVRRAVAGDIGSDLVMRGWATGPIVADVKIRDGSAVIAPMGKLGGPMRVLEAGRHQGNASGFQGPGVNVKTGQTARTKSGAVRKVRARKGSRWNGRTTGKRTWSDAESLMDRALPPVFEAAVTRKVGEILG